MNKENPSKSLSSTDELSHQDQDSLQLVEQIYREYAPSVDPSRWPWEKTRWYELIFCILFSIGEPEVPAAAIRELTTILSNFGLLEVDSIASWRTEDEKARVEQVTVKTLLEKSGFSSSQSEIALNFMEEAAIHIQQSYESKIQIFLRRFGEDLLLNIKKELNLDEYPTAHQALSLWLQNTLNMPIPAIDPLAEKACQKLGVEYKVLVEAATAQDINIALLDDALRSYWETETSENEYQEPIS